MVRAYFSLNGILSASVLSRRDEAKHVLTASSEATGSKRALCPSVIIAPMRSRAKSATAGKAAAEAVKALYGTYIIGWSSLSGKVRNKYIATNLTPREHEVAKLTAFGFKASEIASMLYLSESTIKQTVTRVLNKTGIQEKSELYLIL